MKYSNSLHLIKENFEHFEWIYEIISVTGIMNEKPPGDKKNRKTITGRVIPAD